MASIYKNDKKFLIIQMTGKEATEVGFGISVTGLLNSIVCGTCNTSIEHKDIYYVCALNEVMCLDCLEDWIKNMNHYIDDDSLEYEIRHFNCYSKLLNMDERVALTLDGKCIICNKNDINEIRNSYT